MTNIGAILEAAGTSWDKVVKTTILLADMSYFGEVNEIYGEYFALSRGSRVSLAWLNPSALHCYQAQLKIIAASTLPSHHSMAYPSDTWSLFLKRVITTCLPCFCIAAKYFPSNPPARATFAVKGLPLGALVEIEAVALQ